MAAGFRWFIRELSVILGKYPDPHVAFLLTKVERRPAAPPVNNGRRRAAAPPVKNGLTRNYYAYSLES